MGVVRMLNEVLITLKIGRETYEITEADTFIDDGVCVQLLSQDRYPQAYPTLSKRYVKELSKFARTIRLSNYKSPVEVFGIHRLF
tara:strand:- start:207 stop:461 length:255 start_codon:yes stop_codon:yes gene_type:complete